MVCRPLFFFLWQNDHRKAQNLMLALGEQIDGFFAKDPEQEFFMQSFCYWTELAGVSQIEVRLRNSMIW